jgi:membrane peptidoglycan carboxypeptidase
MTRETAFRALSAPHLVQRRRARALRRAESGGRRRFWGSLIALLFGVGIVVPGAIIFGITAAVAGAASAGLPPAGLPLRDAVAALAARAGDTTTFYDRTGQAVLYQTRDPLVPDTWVALGTLPDYVISATLISEDPGFLVAGRYDGFGALLRLWQQIAVGGVPADVTITGRLVENVAGGLLTADGPGGIGDRRSREIALVSALNTRYTPAELLEWHLNTNRYGGSGGSGDVFGIEAAAQLYLGKRAVDLTLPEAALLAAIPTAPQYDPLRDEAAARARAADLLRALYAAGQLGDDQLGPAVAALTGEPGAAAPVAIAPSPAFTAAVAPDYTRFARAQAVGILDALGLDGRAAVARGGLRITTTLDRDLQAQSECARDAALARLNGTPAPASVRDAGGADMPCLAAALLPPLSVAFTVGQSLGENPGLPPDQASIVVLDARTGEVRALVGDALSAAYAPAGTLLPFVYLEGFNGGTGGLLTPATMVYDIPREYPGSEEGLIYQVANPDSAHRGPVSVRAALGGGLLPPAAEIAYRQGMSSILRTAHQMGLNSLDEGLFDILLLERGGRAAVLDLAYAYSVFAAMGDMRGVATAPAAPGYRARDPVAVLEIADADGRVLWAYDRAAAAACQTFETCTPLLEAGLAYLVNDILADAETRWDVNGRENVLDRPGRENAVVNTLSEDRLDNWTAGYTPEWVAVVHVTRSDRQPLALPPYALDGAAALWRAVLDYTATRPLADPVAPVAAGWARPASVVEAIVCQTSGLAPNGICPTTEAVFFDGTQPRALDTFWQNFEINRSTDQLATVNTPAGDRTTARYFVPPEDLIAWWRENRRPLPPTEVDTVSVAASADLARGVRIVAPDAYSYVGGEVELRAEFSRTLRGGAAGSPVEFYQVSYGQGLNPAAWNTLVEPTPVTADAPLPADDDAIARWNTAGLDGLYSVRVLASLGDNRVESDVLLVTVDNLAPTVRLETAEPGAVFRWPRDTEAVITAEAEDNLLVERVEFYHDGVYLGDDTSWPFQLTWAIERPGPAVFTAIAYDAVGNSAQAALTLDVLRAGG